MKVIGKICPGHLKIFKKVEGYWFGVLKHFLKKFTIIGTSKTVFKKYSVIGLKVIGKHS